MRTISANNDAILKAGARAVAMRLQVKDAGGTFRDLTTYPGVDLVQELSWGEDLDADGVTWSATLAREQRQISLAPLVAASPLNHGFNPAASYAPLLQSGREMKFEYSMQAYGDPRSRTWVTAFGGYIDTVDSASGDTVKLTGRGLEAVIVNCFIQRERIYGLAQGTFATKGVYVWPDSTTGATYTTFAVGDLVVPTDAKRNDHFYRATAITTGIVAATEPTTWPTGSGATVVDGGVTWTESGATSISTGTAVETIMQQMLNDNMGSAPTLWCPTSPSWLVRWFLVGRQPLFAELKALADQIGWCLCYSDNSGTPALKLFDPLRSTTTSLRTFSPSTDYADPNSLKTDWKDIRNHDRIVYGDSQDPDPNGDPKRKALERTDSASITKYGELFCEAAEGSTDNIDTSTEAGNLADRMLSDLAEPTAEMEIPLLFLFLFVERCDLYTFAADGVRFDSDQKFAVSSYKNEWSKDAAFTTLTVRGKPASKSGSGWMTHFASAFGAANHQLTTIQNVDPFVMTVDTAPVGGARFNFPWRGAKSKKDAEYELHLSKTPGFTADSTTLIHRGSDRFVEPANLDPAVTYYGQLIPVILNAKKPVRGQPSAEFSFVPGRAQATHLNPDVEWGRLPLNGGFETQLDPTNPPDFWTVLGGAFGTWGVNAFLLSDASGISGSNYLQLKSTSAGVGAAIVSSEFNINGKLWYAASFWRKAISGTQDVTVSLTFYDENHIPLGSGTAETFALNTSVGTWVQHRTAAQLPPGGSRFATFALSVPANASTQECHFDDLRMEDDERWHVIGAGGEPAFAHSWAALGGSYAPPRFMRTADGWIVLAGIAASGTIGLSLATLPSGYRPAEDVVFPVPSNGAYGQASITSAGVLTIDIGNNTSASLDGIRYRAAP